MTGYVIVEKMQTLLMFSNVWGFVVFVCYGLFAFTKTRGYLLFCNSVFERSSKATCLDNLLFNSTFLWCIKARSIKSVHIV